MNEKRWNYLGIVFLVVAMCAGCAIVNHILNTKESLRTPLVLLALGICGAVTCFKKSKKQ